MFLTGKMLVFVQGVLIGAMMIGLFLCIYGVFFFLNPTGTVTTVKIPNFLEIESPLHAAVFGFLLFWTSLHYLNPKEREVLDKKNGESLLEIIKCLRLALSSIDNCKERLLEKLLEGTATKNVYDLGKLKKKATVISKEIITVAISNKKIISGGLYNELIALSHISDGIHQLSNENTRKELNTEVNRFKVCAKRILATIE